MEPDLGTSVDQAAEDPSQEPDPAGAGPTGGTTFTVYFPTADGYLGADLAHPAPLPRVGDEVDYLDEDGTPHRYRVVRIVHTLQAAPAYRPRGRPSTASASDPSTSEASAADAPPAAAGRDEAAAVDRLVPEGSELRAGLPEVFLAELSAKDAPGAG